MSPVKKPSHGFTSLRILGKRAQDMLRRATEKPPVRPQKPTAPLPPPEEIAVLKVRFSLASIAQASLVILAIVIGAWMIFALRDKIVLLLLGFFVAAIIDPGVRWFERLGVPRGLGILFQYVIALCIMVFLVVSLIPILSSQLQQIALLISVQVNAFLLDPQISFPFMNDEVNRRLTDLVRATLENLSINQFTDALQQFSQSLSSFAQGSVVFATRLAGSVVDFFFRMAVVLVLAFFIQLEKESIRRWLQGFFPPRYKHYMDSKTDAIHWKIGQWARGQLLLGISVGLLVFLALWILRMPYAATLAVLAGFTELIPYVGPFIAAVPSVLIAITQGGFLWAVVVAVVYYIVQWCENNLLVPLIMKRAVGLSPIAIIFAMLVGVSFPAIVHPILGILLAVPVTTIITLFLEDWRQRPLSSNGK